MTNINALASDYLTKRAAHSAAYNEEVRTRKEEHEAGDLVEKAMKEDCVDQIGFCFRTNPIGEVYKIVRIAGHYQNKSLMQPVVVTRIQSGDWGKRDRVLNSMGFDRETRSWRPVKVAQDGTITFTA